MKRTRLTLILMVFSGTYLFGQTIGASLGLNSHHFYDFRGNNESEICEYTNGFGYSFAMSICKNKSTGNSFLTELRFDSYRGHLYRYSAGKAGGGSVDAEVHKQTLGIDIYPLNISIWNRFRFALGMEINVLVGHQTTGTKRWWADYGFTSETTLLEDSNEMLHEPVNVGFCSKLSYEFSLKHNWKFSPTYRIFSSWLPESPGISRQVYTMRHNFEIGLFNSF